MELIDTQKKMDMTVECVEEANRLEHDLKNAHDAVEKAEAELASAISWVATTKRIEGEVQRLYTEFRSKHNV